ARRTGGSSTGARRSRRTRTRNRTGTPGPGASRARATGAGSAPRTQRARTRRAAGRSRGGRRRSRRSAAQTGAGARSGSGATPGNDLRLVLQLAPVLDQVAVRADELGWLGGHHLDREGLQALLTGQGEDGVVLLLGLLGAGLLLDQDVLDRFDVLVATGGRGRGGRAGRRVLIGGAGLGTLLVDLFVFARVFEVFHLAIPLFGRGIVLPGISLATVPGQQRRRELIHSQIRCGQARTGRSREGRGDRVPDGSREGTDEDPRDLWGRGAGALRSLLSLLGPPCACRRGDRRSAEVSARLSGCQMRRCQTA